MCEEILKNFQPKKIILRAKKNFLKIFEHGNILRKTKIQRKIKKKISNIKLKLLKFF